MPVASIDDTYQRIVDDIRMAANAVELNRVHDAYFYLWVVAPERWLTVIKREFEQRMTALSAS